MPAILDAFPTEYSRCSDLTSAASTATLIYLLAYQTCPTYPTNQSDSLTIGIRLRYWWWKSNLNLAILLKWKHFQNTYSFFLVLSLKYPLWQLVNAKSLSFAPSLPKLPTRASRTYLHMVVLIGGGNLTKSETKNFWKACIIYAINIDLPLKWWSFWRKFPSIMEALLPTAHCL